MIINPKNIPTKDLHQFILAAVSPRPIAFVSTVDADGRPNLAPYSFFNAFSSNPPILVFSSNRKVSDNTTKHTLANVETTKEVVINVVTHNIVEQVSLSSADYPKGINEFEKAGFTPIPSDDIRPFRVKESPVQFECKVQQVIETGTEGGAGNLVICHITKIHINHEILNEDGTIDAALLDIVGRLGGDDYIRAKKSAFTIPKPVNTIGMGIDALPEFIRSSSYLSGKELARLGSLERLPKPDEIKHYSDRSEPLEIAFEEAVDMIDNDNAWEALCYLMNFEHNL